MKTLVIAEPGSTHMGRWPWLEDCIQMARDAGADAIKFQWVSSVERLCERRNAKEYEQAYRLINFPTNWLEGLARETERRGLKFMCTAYLPEDVKTIAPYVSAFKMASFEAEQTDIMTAIQTIEGAKDIYISTGLLTELELDALFMKTYAHGRVKLLYCVSGYPVPLDQMNLGCLRSGYFSGLSDHSRCEDMGAYAVIVGATVIETHFMHPWCHSSNPDYKVSFFPNKYGNYIDKIRRAEKIYGEGTKKIQPCEEPMLKYRVKT